MRSSASLIAHGRNLLTTHTVGLFTSQLSSVDRASGPPRHSRPVTEPVRDTGRQVAIHAHIHDGSIILTQLTVYKIGLTARIATIITVNTCSYHKNIKNIKRTTANGPNTAYHSRNHYQLHNIITRPVEFLQ